MKANYISLLFIFLICVHSSLGFCFSTHTGLTVTREFDSETASIDSAITVTTSIVNTYAGGFDLRGFYYTDHIPAGLAVETVSVSLAGATASYMFEAGSEGDVYSGCIPYRWILETPPSFSESSPLTYGNTLKIVYTVRSSVAGSLELNEYNWVGYYDAAPTSYQEAFGYSEENENQTLLFSEGTGTIPQAPVSLRILSE